MGGYGSQALGSGWVIGQELLFDEQLIKYKFSYWESKYSRMDGAPMTLFLVKLANNIESGLGLNADN